MQKNNIFLLKKDHSVKSYILVNSNPKDRKLNLRFIGALLISPKNSAPVKSTTK